MTQLVPLKFVKSVETIYELLNNQFSKFSLFKVTNKVGFDEKVKFIKSLTEKDVSKLSNEQKMFLGKILENILQEINSKFSGKPYVTTQSDLANALSEYQSQLINLIIKYEESENRVLLHYSQFPTYSRDWNNLTKYSRGIVFDLDDYSIVVHPYDKFFNYLEHEETKDNNLPDLPYEVSTKLDGSEGILYPAKDGSIRIITKGSFDSEQGKFATELLWSKYKHQVNFISTRRLYNNYTFTFEIIYSKDDPNRIVVAYDEPDLRLIGVRDLKTNKDLSYAEVIKMAQSLGFPHTEVEEITLEEIMYAREERENFEGWVVRFENGLYMKIKCAAYLDLHGARFGSSLKSVFNLLKEEKWDDFIASVPEEIKPIPEAIQKRLIKFARYHTREITNIYYSLPEFESQKEFALYVQNNVDSASRGYMFKLRTGKEVNVFDKTWMNFKILFEAWEASQNE